MDKDLLVLMALGRIPEKCICEGKIEVITEEKPDQVSLGKIVKWYQARCAICKVPYGGVQRTRSGATMWYFNATNG